VNIQPLSYNTAIITALVDCFRKYFAQEEVYTKYNVQNLPIDWELPLTLERYPFLQVSYQSKGVVPNTQSPLEWRTGTEEEFIQYANFIYDGNVRLFLYANNDMECARIADILWAAIACSPTAQQIPGSSTSSIAQLLYANDYIGISPNLQSLEQGPFIAAMGTPWDEDTPAVYTDFTFPITGEFTYTVEAVPVFVKQVDVIATPLDKS